MTIPTIHMNGSGKAELMNQLGDAYTAVRAAINAMAQARPHNRDYYVTDDASIGGSKFRAARDEHFAREAALEAIQKDLMALRVGIADQGRR